MGMQGIHADSSCTNPQHLCLVFSTSKPGPVLTQILGVWLVETAISTNHLPKIYVRDFETRVPQGYYAGRHFSTTPRILQLFASPSTDSKSHPDPTPGELGPNVCDVGP